MDMTIPPPGFEAARAPPTSAVPVRLTRAPT